MNETDDTGSGPWRMDSHTRAEMRNLAARRSLASGDAARAILEAEEALDEAPQDADALLIVAEAELALERPLVARRALAGLTTARAWTLRAEACWGSADLLGTVEAGCAALAAGPETAALHDRVGAALERLSGREAEGREHRSRATEMDAASFPPPLGLDARAFETATASAVKRLKGRLARLWRDVPMRLEPWPTLEDLHSESPPLHPDVDALYEGEPPEPGEGDVRPTALRLFRRNLDYAADASEVADRVFQALVDEGTAWLGDSEPA